MTAVFGHGRLRLYLLRLLADGPKHGYELIRLLEDTFHGLYAPSAGTIYPRLQRLEAEGRVTHTAAGGRKVYEITESGRDELRQRASELASLEAEIRASVADLSQTVAHLERDLRGSVRDLRVQLREAVRQAGRAAADATTFQLRVERCQAPESPSPSSRPWSPSDRADRGARAGEVDRLLGEFVDTVRGLADAARRGGSDAGLVADTVRGTLDEALARLRQLLP